MIREQDWLSQRQAVSMLELLIAVFVLAVALVPLFDLFRHGSQTMKMEREHVLATSLASELVDQIVCIPFRNIPIVGGTPISTTPGEELYLVQNLPTSRIILTDLPDGFERTLTIENISEKLKKIQAVVSWGPQLSRNVSCQVLLEWSP